MSDSTREANGQVLFQVFTEPENANQSRAIGAPMMSPSTVGNERNAKQSSGEIEECLEMMFAGI